MGLAINAAYETVPSGFSVDTINTHFVSGPKAALPLQIKVQRLSESGRFMTRVVDASQSGTTMVHVTCSFVRTSAMKGPSMTHAGGRKTTQTINAITLDDLELGRDRLGPYMKFQRLPLVYDGPGAAPRAPPPESFIYTSVAQISPSIPTADPRTHALGIICLSDYHILDAPPTLHGITFENPLIGDTQRTPTQQNFERMTSLSHTVHFHIHDGFRADDLCYIEVTCPWTNGRRAEVDSRIFDKDGKLIATCVQGSYYVLNESQGQSKL